MSKIAVIGDFESIYGYSTLGLDIFVLKDYEQGKKILSNLAQNDYAIIYVTEKYMALLEKEISKYDDLSVPAIIPIPGISQNNGMGIGRVKKAVEKAVGSDILFGE